MKRDDEASPGSKETNKQMKKGEKMIPGNKQKW